MKIKFLSLLENRIPSGSFARNVTTLMTGTTFAQILLILVAPILTRLYSPKDFGVYSLYTSIASILTVIACLNYDYAIVLPKKDEDGANVLGLSILICLNMVGVTFILVFLLRSTVARYLNAPTLAIFLWFIPLSVLGSGLFKVFNYWSTRRKQFKRLAVRQINQSIITSVTQVGVGTIFNAGPGGLISGLIIGQFAATGRLAWQIFKEEGNFLKSCISIKKLKCMAKRYKKFPLYDSWSGLFNTASSMLPALLLGYFFTPAVVGFYALGHKVLAMPMNIIGSSIAQVFYPRATKAKHDGNLDKVTLNIFEHLLAIGFIPLMLIALVAPNLFALIFGHHWWIAGQYVRWMSLWLLCQFISSPISLVYYVMEKQKSLLVFNIIMFFIRLLVIIIGGIQGKAMFSIALLGITGAVLYVLLCMHITNITGIKALPVFLIILKQVALGIPYCIPSLLILYVSDSSIAAVFVAIFSGIVFLLRIAYRIKKYGKVSLLMEE